MKTAQKELIAAYIGKISEVKNTKVCQLCNQDKLLIRHFRINSSSNIIEVWSICRACNYDTHNLDYIHTHIAPIFTIHSYFSHNGIGATCYFCKGLITGKPVRHHYVNGKDIFVVVAHRGCNAGHRHNPHYLPKGVLSISQAASLLGISKITLYTKLNSQEYRKVLGAYKLAGEQGTRHHWRFRLSSLKLFLQGNGNGKDK